MPPSRTVFVLNGAEERLQIVLGTAGETDDLHGQVVYAKELRVPGRGMQHLAPALAEALASLGLGPTALSGLACVRGPGSFTGLRLVLSTAFGLSASTGVPMAGLDYLPLLAATAAECVSGTVHVLVHARARLVYLQSFRAGGGMPPHPSDDIRVVSLEAAVEAVSQAAGPAVLLGSGLRRNLGFFGPALRPLPQVTLLSPAWDTPRPETLLRAALAARYAHAPLEPMYLRPSDAEENLAELVAVRGLQPAEAYAWLDRARDSVASMSCPTPMRRPPE